MKTSNKLITLNIKKVNLFENNANNNIYAYFDNDKLAN